MLLILKRLKDLQSLCKDLWQDAGGKGPDGGLMPEPSTVSPFVQLSSPHDWDKGEWACSQNPFCICHLSDQAVSAGVGPS